MGIARRKHPGQTPMRLAATGAFLLDWVNSKEAARAPGTAKRYRHTIESSLVHIGGKSKWNLAGLTPHDIETLRDAGLKSGKGATTANRTAKGGGGRTNGLFTRTRLGLFGGSP